MNAFPANIQAYRYLAKLASELEPVDQPTLASKVESLCKKIAQDDAFLDAAFWATALDDSDLEKYKSLIIEAVYDIVRNYRLLKATQRRNKGFSLYEAWLGLVSFHMGHSTEPAIAMQSTIAFLRDAGDYSTLYSISESLWKQIVEEGIESKEEVLASLCHRPSVFCRVNTSRSDTASALKSLREEKLIATIDPDVPGCLVLLSSAGLFRSKTFQSGLIEMQDKSSQRVTLHLNPQPGERVCDACAGAGGKTLAIADAMEDKGRVIAMDTHEGRLRELERRLARVKFASIELRHLSTTKRYKRLAQSIDRVLIDAPCTGTGVYRRNVDARQRFSTQDLQNLCSTQAELLRRYSSLVRKGGTLVYSVCSILKSEGEWQVRDFLSQNATWRLAGEWSYGPHIDGGDGFYIAKLDVTD